MMALIQDALTRLKLDDVSGREEEGAKWSDENTFADLRERERELAVLAEMIKYEN